MRASPLVLLALLLAPVALANGDAFTLVSARLESIYEPEEDIGSRWDVTFAVRNDGAAGHGRLMIHEAPIIFDLMYTQWVEDAWFEAGETRTYTVRLDLGLPDTIFLSNPDWFCLDVTGSWVDRCWSVLGGPALPDGTFPDDIVHWQLTDVPHGDSP